MSARPVALRTCLLLSGAFALSCSAGEPASPTRASNNASSGEVAQLLLGAEARGAASQPAAGAASQPAAGAAQCGVAQERVLITVVDGPGDLHRRRAEAGDTAIVSEDAETVVFADGRILTSRLDGVGEHLGRLGWIEREIVISSRFQKRGGATLRRRRG